MVCKNILLTKNFLNKSRHHYYLEFAWMPKFCNELKLLVLSLYFLDTVSPALMSPAPGAPCPETRACDAWHCVTWSPVVTSDDTPASQLQASLTPLPWHRASASDWSLDPINRLSLVAMVSEMNFTQHRAITSHKYLLWNKWSQAKGSLTSMLTCDQNTLRNSLENEILSRSRSRLENNWWW